MRFKKYISLVLIGMIVCLPSMAFAAGGKINIQFEASCVAADGTFSVNAFVESDEVGKTSGGQNISAAEMVLTYPASVELVNGKMGSDVFPDVVIQNDRTESGKWKLMFGKVGYYNPVTAAADRKPFAIMDLKIPAGKKISDLTGSLSAVADPVAPRVFNDHTENVYGSTIDLVLNTLTNCGQVAAVVNPPAQQPAANQPAQNQPVVANANQPVLQPGQDIHQPIVQNQNAAPAVYGGQPQARSNVAQTPTDAHAAATGTNTQAITTATSAPTVSTGNIVQTGAPASVIPQPAAYHSAADLQETGPAEDLMVFALIGAGIWTFYWLRKSTYNHQI